MGACACMLVCLSRVIFLGDSHWREACTCLYGMACCLSFFVIMLYLCGILIDLWVWGFCIHVGVSLHACASWVATRFCLSSHNAILPITER